MAPTRDLACNPGMCPDWESNWQPFGLQPMLNPMSYASQGTYAVLRTNVSVHSFKYLLNIQYVRGSSCWSMMVRKQTPKMTTQTINRGTIHGTVCRNDTQRVVWILATSSSSVQKESITKRSHADCNGRVSIPSEGTQQLWPKRWIAAKWREMREPNPVGIKSLCNAPMVGTRRED